MVGMITKLRVLIEATIKDLYDLNIDVSFERPEEQFGDLSTNVSFRLAKELKRSPLDVAKELSTKIKNDNILEVNVAGAGFLNFTLANKALMELARSEPSKPLEGKVVVVEYSDPNPFKVLHAGHLYTSVIGDGIANLIEVAGAKVYRVNFGGDIGLHVAKAVWGVISELGGELPDKLSSVKSNKAEWLSQCYIKGNDAYESDDKTREDIKDLNKKIYKIAVSKDKESNLAKIYWTCRNWSYQYFNEFYSQVGIKFDKYYPESEVAEDGVKTVKDHMPDVYQLSQGAVIFDGEKYGLYKNVFINSKGVPTYAAKDVGLIINKWQDYHFDKSVIITANEITDYMRVVLKSIEQFNEELVKRTVHLTHGLVKLVGAEKMSSRKGNILKASDILDLAKKATAERKLNSDQAVIVGAVKYSFIKQSIGGDIIFNPSESVSIEGNSGPYLQYALVRATSILSSLNNTELDMKDTDEFTKYERSLLLKIGEYHEVIDLAVSELKPHYLATYLYDLAQNFNRFYENSHVINDKREKFRGYLVKLYADRLASGLKLLGLETVKKM